MALAQPAKTILRHSALVSITERVDAGALLIGPMLTMGLQTFETSLSRTMGSTVDGVGDGRRSCGSRLFSQQAITGRWRSPCRSRVGTLP